MDNFDLKKYLVENKITTNTKMLNEDESDIKHVKVGKNKKILVNADLQYEDDTDDQIRFIIQQNNFNVQDGAIAIVRIEKKGRDLFKLKQILRDILEKEFPNLAFKFVTEKDITEFNYS
jgi:hypothetical protein